MPMSSGVTWKPGQQFIARASSLSSGTAALTIPINKNDLTQVGGVILKFTTGGTTTAICTTLGSTNTYLGRVVECVDTIDANSELNKGKRRVVTGYVVSTQTFTFATQFPQTTQVGDTFKILAQAKGASKIGLSSISSQNASNADPIINSFNIVDSIGFKFATQFTTSTRTPAFTFMPVPVPIEFDLGEGDATITVVTTAAYASVNDYYFTFVYS